MFARSTSEGSSRALDQRERLAEERERRRDARDQVAADPEPEEELGRGRGRRTRGPRRARGPGRAARARRAHRPSGCGPRPRRRAGGPAARRRRSRRPRRAHARTRRSPRRTRASRRAPRPGRAPPRRGRARRRRRRSRGTTGRPERDGEPLDRLGRRARLAALDLGDVLLREAVACELGLGQSGRDAELTQRGRRSSNCGRPSGHHALHASTSSAQSAGTSPELQSPERHRAIFGVNFGPNRAKNRMVMRSTGELGQKSGT